MNEASSIIGKHPCRATGKDGQPCTVRALPASAWCFAHDPDRTAERDAARRRGGAGKSRAARLGKLLPATLKPVLARLLNALDEVHAATLTPQQAGAMASLAGAIVKLYQVGALEERLSALEATQDGGRWSA